MLKDRLFNWALAIQGETGPQPDTHCRSAERNYLPEAGAVWEDDDTAEILPDYMDADIVEKAVCSLREELRVVIKARYVSFPYHNINHVAHFIRMSPRKFQTNLDEAHRRLSNKLGEYNE